MNEDKELLGRVAAAAADAEAHRDAEFDWVRHEAPSKSPAAVYSVRIPVDRIEELRALAADRGVAPTALIRTWVIGRLDAARTGDERARQWENDVRATIDKLRTLLDEQGVS